MHTIHNWKVIQHKSSEGKDLLRITGKLFGDSNFAPDELISTSILIGYREVAGSTIVMTQGGSEYLLGRPVSDFRVNFQLIKSLKKRGTQDWRIWFFTSLVLIACLAVYFLFASKNGQVVRAASASIESFAGSHHVLSLKVPESSS